MNYYKHSTSPGEGLQPEVMEHIKLWNRSGARLQGDLVMLDEHASDTAVSTFDIGTSTSAWNNVIAPTVAGTREGTFLVCEEDIADDAQGLFTLMSENVEVQSEATTDLDEVGVAQASDTMDVLTVPTGYVGQKIIGRPREIASAGLVRYHFNGFGFGQGTVT